MINNYFSVCLFTLLNYSYSNLSGGAVGHHQRVRQVSRGFEATVLVLRSVPSVPLPARERPLDVEERALGYVEVVEEGLVTEGIS